MQNNQIPLLLPYLEILTKFLGLHIKLFGLA